MPTIKTKKLFLFLFIRYHKNFGKNVFKIQTQENTAKATVYICLGYYLKSMNLWVPKHSI